ncbi:MAG: prolyl oligopeptidase family serine peptidase, partial [Saprospiraceae bacterium]|nr:prolyl oligopeptidase family serine peptidase [Saprospiraceae bacterium]
HFSWLYQAGVHRVLDQMLKDKQLNPFMLVMPSDGLAGDGTGYLPHVVKDYEKWIIEDVFEAINYHFPEISTKSSAFITGLSMGGYGALHLGIKHHQLFDGISAHSAITDLSDFQSFIDEQHQTFISPKNIQEARIIDYAQKFKENIPPLRFDCGVEDRLIESNRKLHKQLEQDQIDHKYEEFSGSHNYEYWTTHISRSFSFFQEIINWHQ